MNVSNISQSENFDRKTLQLLRQCVICNRNWGTEIEMGGIVNYTQWYMTIQQGGQRLAQDTLLKLCCF